MPDINLLFWILLTLLAVLLAYLLSGWNRREADALRELARLEACRQTVSRSARSDRLSRWDGISTAPYQPVVQTRDRLSGISSATAYSQRPVRQTDQGSFSFYPIADTLLTSGPVLEGSHDVSGTASDGLPRFLTGSPRAAEQTETGAAVSDCPHCA